MKVFWRLYALTKIVTLLLIFGLVQARAQSSPRSYLSTAASESATVVFAQAALLKVLTIINTNATLYYLKLYDKATMPVCGTDVPVWRLPLPASTTNPVPLVPHTPDGLIFDNGIGFCITAGVADTDVSNATSGIAINFGIGGRPH